MPQFPCCFQSVSICMCETEILTQQCAVCVKDPLNSGDDVSDADPTEVFDAENVIVCQFDKVCLLSMVVT